MIETRIKGERVKEFIDRLHIDRTTFWRRLNHKRCPHAEMEKGPSGRILAIYTNPRFDEFVKEGV